MKTYRRSVGALVTPLDYANFNLYADPDCRKRVQRDISMMIGIIVDRTSNRYFNEVANVLFDDGSTVWINVRFLKVICARSRKLST